MDAKVHPSLVVLVLLIMALGIGLWSWATGNVAAIGGPAQLVRDPVGHVYVQIQDQLLEHDAEGAFLARHDLGRLGVAQLVGGLGFFANGDLLLRVGADQRSPLDRVRAFLRMTNRASLEAERSDAGLRRCNLRSASCEPFGADPIDPQSAFGVAIDTRSDEVYLSDTTRHVLRKYTAAGTTLATAPETFKFPNQVLLDESRLYVADTNHHRVVELDPSDESFGAERSSAKVVPREARRAGHRWPAAFERVADQWWVINVSADMSHGGIYVFDAEWNYLRRVELPPDADPIAMLVLGDEVLVSDFGADRVHRLSTSGILLGDFRSAGLAEVIAEGKVRRTEQRRYAYLGIALMCAVFAGLLSKGLHGSGEGDARTRVRTRTLSRRASSGPSDGVVWLARDPKTVSQFRLMLRLLGGLFVVATALLGYLYLSEPQMPFDLEMLLVSGTLLGFFVMMVWIGRNTMRTGIGVRDKEITLRDHNGREGSWAAKDLFYDGTCVASRDMAVFLGQPAMPVFERQAVVTHLYPALGEARAITPIRMQARLIRIRHPHGMLLLGIVIGLPLIALVMMLTALS